MPQLKRYAGVGARKTPIPILAEMEAIARKLHSKDYVLRSGGAKGADQAFEKGSQLRCEIFLPKDDLPLWTYVFVHHFHPASTKLSTYVFQLMQRNAMILLGRNGNTPVEFVVCWTEGGEFVGGTGHTLKIAQSFNIPIYNLYDLQSTVGLDNA